MQRDKYKGKKFSILGDSISTFQGYSEPEDAAFYDISRKLESEIITPADTWWGQVIEYLGGELLVNNSISGSTVCRNPFYEVPSYACSKERTSSLAKGDVLPDVIMIYMGTNDWGRGTRIHCEELNDGAEESLELFSVAYRTMLKELKQNYPDAEIWCFTLPISCCTSREGFAFPYCYGGRHIDEYCQEIRCCASELGCRLIDIRSYNRPYDTIDGFHPNAEGMKTIANSVIGGIEK